MADFFVCKQHSKPTVHDAENGVYSAKKQIPTFLGIYRRWLNRHRKIR